MHLKLKSFNMTFLNVFSGVGSVEPYFLYGIKLALVSVSRITRLSNLKKSSSSQFWILFIGE